jgi:NRPS condensation-like uncharacterized protein
VKQPRTPRNWGFPSTNRADTGERTFAMRRFGPETFTALNALADAHSATLLQVYLAAYFRSLLDLLESPANTPFTILVPVSLRRYLPGGKAEAICNLFTMVPVQLSRVLGERFESTLERIRDSTSVAFSDDRVIGNAVKQVLLSRLAPRIVGRRLERIRTQAVEDGFTNPRFSTLRPIPAQALDFGLPVVDAYAIPHMVFAPGIIMIAISFRKRLCFSMNYCARSMQPAVVERFMDMFARELIEAAQGRRTDYAVTF